MVSSPLVALAARLSGRMRDGSASPHNHSSHANRHSQPNANICRYYAITAACDADQCRTGETPGAHGALHAVVPDASGQRRLGLALDHEPL